jgi:hypothetical protein
MNLLWLRYRGQHQRHILLLELGRINNKICGIDADKLGVVATGKIKSAKAVLEGLPLPRRVAWMKQFCPEALTHYKTINVNNAVVLKTYSL